ncbi:glutamate--cysteine ligase isoform X2 [Microplitis demolitor]|nr:glutamate--cysteine ligase isoform X2 [Microplitis demolitor]
MLVKLDDDKKTAKLSLRSYELMVKLNEKEQANPSGVKCLWRPEFGAYMIEGTPGQPYGGLLAHFNIVEANMRHRRLEAEEQLKSGEVLMTFTNFLRLGCPNSTEPPAKPTPDDGYQRSLFLPDEAVFPGHPRFKTLATNIRQRRGEKVIINVPIYKDENVPKPFREDLSALGDDGRSAKVAKDDHIYMDAMGFGMGCCCLQVTFQASNIQEARTLYDQLTPLCPIMLALTAASPVYRGYLADIDSRWFVVSNSVDCRTKGERGLEPLKDGEFVIKTSRYGSVESYLSEQGDKYNDTQLLYDKEVYKQLMDNGIDRLLAQHVAHLFIRDSICLMSTQLDQNDETDTDHFENIQSTNWRSMRFKPPPPNSSIGWRVEFRPCDVQMTDFENAAVVCFIVLLSRVILSYNLNLLMPISKVIENMSRGEKRDAVNKQKFWFRKDIGSADGKDNSQEVDECGEFTVNEIINGKDGVFVGLIPLINSYLNSMNVDVDTHCTVQRYLKLIRKRASGELMTTAAWIRKEVVNHPEYKKDSVVNEAINYDILKSAYEIQKGVKSCPELLGFCTTSRTTETIPAAIANAEK